jgi:hypothetical protein
MRLALIALLAAVLSHAPALAAEPDATASRALGGDGRGHFVIVLDMKEAQRVSDFMVHGGFDGGQCLQKFQQVLAVAQIAACELAHHKGVDDHLCLHQGLNQGRLTLAQMIYPDRGVNQNHAAGRCLGMSVSWGSVPAS